jgi:hypothetical protein
MVSVGSGVAVSVGIGVAVSAGIEVRVGGIVVGTGVIEGAVVNVAGTVLVATGVGIVVFVGVAVLGSAVFGAAIAVSVLYFSTSDLSTHMPCHGSALAKPGRGGGHLCSPFSVITAEDIPAHAQTKRKTPKSCNIKRNDMVSPVVLRGSYVRS